MSFKTSFKDGRLGIGLSTSVNSGAPKYPLDINGDIRLTGAILKSDGTIYTSGSGMGTPGIVSNQTDGVFKIGINNITPTVALDVSGHGLITGDLQLNGTLKDSTGAARIFSNWTIASNTTDLYRPSGNVGIGTTSPDSKLHVEGKTISQGLMIASTEMDTNSDSRPALATRNSSTSIKDYEISAIPYNYTNFTSNYSWDHGFLRIRAGGGNSASQTSYIDLTGYSQNADMNKNIVFGTAGTERMRINSSGNVGIGTTSPDSKLHVNGNITLDACKTGSGYPTGSVGGGISFRAGADYAPDSSTGAYNCSILTYAHDQSTDGLSINGYDGVSFCTGSSTRNERMRIKSNGNVGIGTTTPERTLHLYGSRTDIVFDGNNSSVNFEKHYIRKDGHYLRFRGNDDSTVLFELQNNTYGSNKCSFPSGNVGIGTTSPYSKLEIKGDDYTGDPTNHVSYLLRLTQEYTQDFDTSSPEGGVGMKFLLDNDNNNSWAVGEIYCYCSNNDNTEGDSSLRFRVSDQSTNGGRSESTQGANVDAMTIHHSGNVGIGTTSPDGLLHLKTETAVNVGIADNDTPAAGYHDEFMALKIESKGDTGDVNSISGAIKFASWANPDNSYPNVAPVGSLRFYVNSPGDSSNAYGTTPNTMVMSLAGNGNVGIGTTEPDSKLHVNGTIKTTELNVSGDVQIDDVKYIKWGSSETGASILGIENAVMAFYVNTQAKLVMSNSHTYFETNNVGIGTTSPDQKLHISDSGNTTLKIVSTNSYNPGIELIRTQTAYTGHHNSSVFADDAWTDWKIYNNGSKLQFQGGRRIATSGMHLSNSPQTLVTAMTMLDNGSVGIGTTSPESMLHLKSSGDVILRLEADSDNSGESDNPMIFMSQDGSISSSNQYFKIGMNGDAGAAFTGALGNGSYLSSDDYLQFAVGGEAVMTMEYQNKNVGIGTTSPVVKLHVAPSAAFTTPSNFSNDGTFISDVSHKKSGSYEAYFSGNSTGTTSPYYSAWAGDYDEAHFNSANATSAYFEAGIMVGGRIFLESDERIKHGIEVINDSFALRTIREIECYTYFYNDMIRRTSEITLGFLAQEVREKFPMAVKMKQDFLPVAMTFAQDIIWEEIIDNSKNKFKLTIPILHKDASNNIVEHEPGTKFKFYLTDVSNNINNQDFCVSTLLEDGKSFILEKKSKYVFIYGYLVDDFHILDKEKIFTLHHSAIQEIDRQQQADKAKITDLENEVATLKSELATIKAHLGI